MIYKKNQINVVLCRYAQGKTHSRLNSTILLAYKLNRTVSKNGIKTYLLIVTF